MSNECIFVFCQFRSAQARAHASLGYVYELLQDTDKAIDHYEQVHRIVDQIQARGEHTLICSVEVCMKLVGSWWDGSSVLVMGVFIKCMGITEWSI